MKNRKKISVSAAVIACAALVAGGALRQLSAADAKEMEISYQEVTLQHGDLQLSVTGEGSISNGEILQKPGFDAAAVDFIVEEAYAKSGGEVKKGDALYQISSGSMAEAAAYYEEAIAKAAKEADRAKTAYESGKTKAGHNRTKAKEAADAAKEVYDAANRLAAQKTEEAFAALTDAKTRIGVYQDNLSQNRYYMDSGAEEKKKDFETAEWAGREAEKAYQNAKKEYDAATDAVNGQIVKLQQAASSLDAAALAGLIMELGNANQTLIEKKEAFFNAEAGYESASGAAKNAEEAYKMADASYQKAASDAAARKEELERSLASLEAAYANAVHAEETERIQNKKEYDAAVLEGEYADAAYENQVSPLKEDYDSAAEKLSKLQEGQKALSAVKDGIITASRDGILSQAFYEAGDALLADTALVSYSNPDELTVAAEIAQEDIAKVSIGDAVTVSLAGMQDGGGINGTVAQIAPKATEGRSMSNVTYAVEVAVDNSEGTIAAGILAYLTFPYGELSDVDYIATDALGKIDGKTAVVKTYDKDGGIKEVPVGIGESNGRYTVVTEGITDGMACLIEMGGRKNAR